MQNGLVLLHFDHATGLQVDFCWESTKLVTLALSSMSEKAKRKNSFHLSTAPMDHPLDYRLQ